jgi:hypothetical protein
MNRAGRLFPALAALGLSLVASLLSGGLAAVLIAPRFAGAEGVPAAAWVVTTLPLAAAVVAVGWLSRTPVAAAVNALAFLVPPFLGGLLGFALIAHPSGPTRPDLLLASREFWLGAAVLYLIVLSAIGFSAWLLRVFGGPPRAGGGAPGA